jgi:hypothetical protein
MSCQHQRSSPWRHSFWHELPYARFNGRPLSGHVMCVGNMSGWVTGIPEHSGSPVSKVCPETGYPHWGSASFSSVHSGICMCSISNQGTIASLHILSNSSLMKTNIEIIIIIVRCRPVVAVTDSIIKWTISQCPANCFYPRHTQV